MTGAAATAAAQPTVAAATQAIATAGTVAPVGVATGVAQTGIAEEIRTLTAEAQAATRDAAAEAGATLGPGMTRPPEEAYITTLPRLAAETVAPTGTVGVTTRQAGQITQDEITKLRQIAQGRGVALTDLPEYAMVATRGAQTGAAATGVAGTIGPEVTGVAATGVAATGARITGEAGAIETESPFEAAMRTAQTGTAAVTAGPAQMGTEVAEGATREAVIGTAGPDATAQVVDVTAMPTFAPVATRVAQTGVAATGAAQTLGPAPSETADQRVGITGDAAVGDRTQIGGIPTWEQKQIDDVIVTDRIASAASMAQVTADIPENIAHDLAEDATAVTAQLDQDPDPTVTLNLAAMPQEALVSVQMQSLVAGMDNGAIPIWARPAVNAVDQMMAARGLSASTVGRDALFDAIIQSALPMAHANADTVKQDAMARLTGDQRAQLSAAESTQQIRMQNLANQQTSESQSAQMAQQVKMHRNEVQQESRIIKAQQQQERYIQEFGGEQARQAQIAQQAQQAAIATFDGATQKT